MLIRTVQPSLNFNTKINKLEYNTYTLNNNIPLYSIEDKNQAVCGIEIIFSGGKLEEASKGASYFSTNLLKAGTQEFDSNQINEFFELRGAFVQVQSGLDYNSISLYCLSGKLEEIFPFFLKLFTQPSFPQKQLIKLVKRKEQELDINKQKSNYWATNLLKNALFGNHPYGHVLDKKDLNSISVEELTQHWNALSLNGIQFITAAGNFNISQIKDKIEVALQKTKTISANSQKSVINNKYSLTRKKLKNNQQSSLKIGLSSIQLNSKEYPPLSLGNAIWGGYFGSRLMQSIREDKGLTYGINSSLIHLLNSSYIQISADLKKGAGDEVVDLITKELKSLINSPLKEQEINKVKNYLIGEYKSNSETIFDRISKVKFLKLHNLDDNYYTEHFSSLLNVSSYQIQTILNKTITPESFQVVLVE